MIRNSLTLLALCFILMTSCQQGAKYSKAEKMQTTTQTYTDDNGNELVLTFDNEKDVVVIDYNGTKEMLTSQQAASGIWYTNDTYDLSGKGNDIALRKKGKLIFEHKDDVVKTQSKSTSGDVLDLTFNNTQGTVKAYLNGGDEITMLQQKVASGFWYLNEHYELRGKGENYTLTKDGKVIFENTDDINTVQATNDEGDVLDLTFNNTQGTVKAYLNGGNEIELKEMKAASGIWYSNDTYELSGKGENYTLTKEGEVIFENADDIDTVRATNDKGDVLDLTFNNSKGTVKAYLNGGDEIELKEMKAASGIWYTNDTYELSGKGENYILLKGNEVIFKN